MLRLIVGAVQWKLTSTEIFINRDFIDVHGSDPENYDEVTFISLHGSKNV